MNGEQKQDGKQPGSEQRQQGEITDKPDGEKSAKSNGEGKDDKQSGDQKKADGQKPGAGKQSDEPKDGAGQQPGEQPRDGRQPGEQPRDGQQPGEPKNADNKQGGEPKDQAGQQPGDAKKPGGEGKGSDQAKTDPGGNQQSKGAQKGQEGKGQQSQQQGQANGDAAGQAPPEGLTNGDAVDGKVAPANMPKQSGPAVDRDPVDNTGDAANPEDQKQAGDLVLKKLDEQLKKKEIDPEMLKEMGWTEDQFRKFADRMRQKQDKPPEKLDDPLTRKNRGDFGKGADLRRSTGRAGGSGPQDNQRGLYESRRVAPPPEYRDHFEAYTRSLSKIGSGAAKKDAPAPPGK